MIFGRRLGCVPTETQTQSQTGSRAASASASDNMTSASNLHDFVHCVQQIFIESAKMTMIPAKWAHYLNLPVWRRFEDAADKALSLGKFYLYKYKFTLQLTAYQLRHHAKVIKSDEVSVIFFIIKLKGFNSHLHLFTSSSS